MKDERGIKVFDIDKKEVLRYLGHRSGYIGEELSENIDNIIKICKEISSPKYLYAIFDVAVKNDCIGLKGTNLVFHGKDIYNHLCKADKCAVIAATLGASSEKELLIYQKKSMTDAVIFDCCCSALIESVTDACESEIIEHAKQAGYYTNYRYSPGYGDFPIEIQPSIITALSTEKKIGLTVTENFLLLPRKSVTAVIGIFNEEQERDKKGCEGCNLYESCLKRPQ